MAEDAPILLRSRAPLARSLDDGLSVRLRPIVGSDRGRVQRAYELLSEESRINRFWEKPRELSQAWAERLTDGVDSDHVAWIVLHAEDEEFPGYGGASYWREKSEPHRAELAFTVADAWQRRGLATLLFSILWFDGWREGVRMFTGHCRKENRAMVRWWSDMGGRVEEGTRHWDLQLDLEDPETFLERIPFELTPSYRRIEAASWLRDWLETAV